MKLPWWLREARMVDGAQGAPMMVVRVHRLYVAWLTACALWRVLRSVRISVRWPWGRVS